MSAPVLSISEQKASISGKKKKKKALKNVLTVPDSLKIEPQLIQTGCVKTLAKILGRLLPTARIPVEKTKNSSKDSNEKPTNETQLVTKAKNKRNQLSLGVNALNRNIKKDLISTVLLADNIQPKFLVQHLNLLCYHKKIPFLHMPGLREITKSCLGFPCIAVGFKKNFCDFSEAVEEIISISQTNKINIVEVAQETEHDEEETTDEETEECEENKKEIDETPFTYLYRTSTKERVFVPGKTLSNVMQEKKDVDFINVAKFDNKTEEKNNSPQLQLSMRIKKPVKKLKKLEEFESSEIDNDEDLEVPKKKSKKDWVIDKRPTKQNIKYYPANLMRFPSNSDRTTKSK